MQRLFTKNDMSPLVVGRLWARLRTHFVAVGLQSVEEDQSIALTSAEGEPLETDHELRNGGVYRIEVDDDHDAAVESFFDAEESLSLISEQVPPEPAQELGLPEPGSLRLGGKLSPRPPDYLYTYIVNANDPIATVRSGGVTYLPNGTSAVVFEMAFTFSGADEVNDILRYWVSATHHSPIMEIEQDDLEYLVSQYRQTGREDLFRSNKNENHGDLTRLYRELVDLIGSRDYLISATEYKRRNPGVSLDEATEEIDDLIEGLGGIREIVNGTRNAADLTNPANTAKLSGFMERLRERKLIDTQLWRVVNEILVTATTVTDVATRVAELRAAVEQEESTAKSPGLIQGKRRLMVAVQNYRVSSIPGAPAAVQFQIAMLLMNEDGIAPSFSYWSQDGRRVQHIEESAFPHWVNGSLMIDSGVPDDVFVAERSGRTHASIRPFYFSEWSPVDDYVLYAPSVERMDDGVWDDTNLYRTASARAVNFGERAAVGRISLSTNFQMTPIPVESDLVPMYQYMGMFSQEVQLEFATADRDLLQEMSQIPAQLAALAKQQQQVELPFLVLRSPLPNMADFRQCVIQGMEIRDEPDSTDTWIGTVTLTKYSAKQIQGLDSRMRGVNKDKPSATQTIDALLLDPEAQVHKAGLNAVLDSVWRQQTIKFEGDLLEHMLGFDEATLLKLGQVMGALPDFKGFEGTEGDVKEFLLGLGVWMGAGEYEHRTCLASLLASLDELIRRGYEVIPLHESDPRMRAAYERSWVTSYVNTPDMPGTQSSSVVRFPERVLPIGQPPRDGDIGTFLGRWRNVPYNFEKLLRSMTRVFASAESAASRRVLSQIPEIAEADGFLLRSPQNEEIGYADAMLREVAVPVFYYREILRRASEPGFVGSDQAARRARLDAIHADVERDVSTLAEKHGASVSERPVLDDFVLGSMTRVTEILSNYQIEGMDLLTMSTDPVFGENFSTYPDMRIPKYLDYIRLLKDEDRDRGRTPASYMPPDWHYNYTDVLSAGDAVYDQVADSLADNVDFNRRMLASRYSSHAGETEMTRVDLTFPIDRSLVDAVSSCPSLSVPVPMETIQNAVQKFNGKAPEWMRRESGHMFLRLKGVHDMDPRTQRDQIERLERSIAGIESGDMSIEQRSLVSDARLRIDEVRSRVSALGDRGSAEVWQETLRYVWLERMGSDFTVELPLSALSYDHDDEAFAAMPCIQEELRSMFLSHPSGNFTAQMEADPLAAAQSDQEIDTNLGGIFAEAYGNSPHLGDVSKPHFRGAHMRETQIASPDVMAIDRKRSREDELDTRVFGFKRCFPTYSVIFYEESVEQITTVGNAYLAAAMSEIQIRHSKSNPVSIASLVMANPFDELFQPYASADGRSWKPPLTVGMGVVIKLGYDANSRDLETAFTGQITDITYGREVSILCQSWSVEFMYERGAKGFWDETTDRTTPDSVVRNAWELIDVAANTGVGGGTIYGATAWAASKGRAAWLTSTVTKLHRTPLVVADAARVARLARSGGRFASGARIFRALMAGVRGVGVAGAATGVAAIPGLLLFGVSLAADYVVGTWITSWIASLDPRGERTNAPWHRLNSQAYTLEQYLAQHILMDIRIRHFNTPFYLGFDFISPKNENVFFPTVPELYENMADVLTIASQDKQEDVDGRDSPAFRRVAAGVHGTITRRHAGLVGKEFDYLFKHMTAWEALQNLVWRYPWLDISCRPFDYRSTLFIGRADRYYRFTEQRDENWRNWLNTHKLSRVNTLQKIRDQLTNVKEEFLNEALAFVLPGQLDASQVQRRLSSLRTRATGGDSMRIFNVPVLGNGGHMLDVLHQGVVRFFLTGTTSISADLTPGGTEPRSEFFVLLGRGFTLVQRYFELRKQYANPDDPKLVAEVDRLYRLSPAFVAERSDDLLDSLSLAGDVEQPLIPSLPLSEAYPTKVQQLERIYQKSLYVREKVEQYRNQLSDSPQTRPFRRYHTVSSNPMVRNLVRNNISASDEEMYNQVTMAVMRSFRDVGKDGDRTPKNWHYIDVLADPTIPDHERRALNVQCKTTSDMEVAANIGTSVLKQSVANMYRGEATVTGNPYAFPLDRMVVSDPYNSMYGVCEVSAVSHRFDRAGGYLTSYEPGCVVYARDNVGYLNGINQKSRALLGHLSFMVGAGLTAAAFVSGGTLAPFLLWAGVGMGSLMSVSSGHLFNEIFAEWDGKKHLTPLVIAPMVQNGNLMLAGAPGIRWDVLQDQLDDESLMRRFSDYIKLADTGVMDFWRTRAGLHFGGFGGPQGREWIEAHRINGSFRLFPQNADKQIEHVIGERL